MDAEFALTGGFRNELGNWDDFNAAALSFFCFKKCIYFPPFPSSCQVVMISFLSVI